MSRIITNCTWDDKWAANHFILEKRYHWTCWGTLASFSTNVQCFLQLILSYLMALLKKKKQKTKNKTFIWFSSSFLNCDQTVPQFGKLPYKVAEGLKVNFTVHLNGSWKQNISIHVHLLSYLLPENSWLPQKMHLFLGSLFYVISPLRCLLNQMDVIHCFTPQSLFLQHAGD